MIRPISVIDTVVKSPTVRNLATATMLTAAVLGIGACAGGNSNKVAEQEQTEVVSKEGAEAIKAAASVTTNAVSNGLSEKIINAINEEFWLDEAIANEHINEVLEVSKKAGPAVAVVVAQSKVSHSNMIEDMKYILREDLKKKGYNYAEAIETKDAKRFSHVLEFEAMEEWLNNTYYPSLHTKLSGKKMSAEEVSSALDEFVTEQPYLYTVDRYTYSEKVKEFKEKQSPELAGTKQGLEDLIAYKTNVLNYVVYKYMLSGIRIPETQGEIKYFYDLDGYNNIAKAERRSTLYSVGY